MTKYALNNNKILIENNMKNLNKNKLRKHPTKRQNGWSS